MSFELPKIYPITSREITKLSHLEQVKRLVKGGAKFIQLRDKDAAPRDFYEAARAVLQFAHAHNVKIIINDRADIALAAGADGVHLGQDDLPPAAARRLLGARAIIGFSTHNAQQAAEACKLPLDYIAVGPIFETRTKSNPDPAVGFEMLAEIRRITKQMPLVAIGGIDFETLPQLFDHGIDSVALISALLDDPDCIIDAVQKFLAAG